MLLFGSKTQPYSAKSFVGRQSNLDGMMNRIRSNDGCAGVFGELDQAARHLMFPLGQRSRDLDIVVADAEDLLALTGILGSLLVTPRTNEGGEASPSIRPRQAHQSCVVRLQVVPGDGKALALHVPQPRRRENLTERCPTHGAVRE